MNTKLILFLAGMALLLSSCEDFIEANLSKKQLRIISPADNAYSSSFTPTFWWEDLKGAESYQIQIVRPSFSAIQQFIIDTTTHASKLTLTLQPGMYQWRIRAKNNSSTTEYQTYTLTIDSTLNLSGQALILNSPANNCFVNSLTVNFSWLTLANSDSYILQILSDNVLMDTHPYIINAGSYTFPEEGSYEWRVFAQNSVSNSSYFTRTITVDTTRPAVPVILSPLTDTITANPIELNWNSVEPGLSFQLQISTDSTFLSTGKDTITTENTYKFYGSAIGQNNYWRVKTIDKALNQSAYCTRKRIRRN